MNFFKRTAQGYLTPPSTDAETTLPTPSVEYMSTQTIHTSSFSYEPQTSQYTPPDTRPSSPNRPTLSSYDLWDTTTYPEHSYLYPAEQNGNWLTTTTHAIKNPNSTASSIHSKVSWSHFRNAVSSATDSANDSLQDNLNRVFSRHDLPAMYDKAMQLVPSVSMPTIRQVNQGIDALADKAQAVIPRRCSEEIFVEQELDRDDLSFARHVGAKAKHALVAQGICTEWQVVTTKETLEWQAQLDSALSCVFREEKQNFSVVQLYGMMPIWTGHVASATWHLELDTGLVEVVKENENEECEEERVCLRVDFALEEGAGRVSVCDVERSVIDFEDWMNVE
jgi:hypothetical protein